ncbi:hypothetical protein TNCV_511511 [Trichonephila clavipes]|nr:hypothetical protein TNCV_511511 [Trichonephila clavipes]
MEFIYVTTIEYYLLNDTLKLLNLIKDCLSLIFCERRIRWPPLPCKFKASLFSPLPVDGVRFLGGQKGLRCSCKMHVWVSSPTKMPTAVDVRRSDVTRTPARLSASSLDRFSFR